MPSQRFRGPAREHAPADRLARAITDIDKQLEQIRLADEPVPLGAYRARKILKEAHARCREPASCAPLSSAQQAARTDAMPKPHRPRRDPVERYEALPGPPFPRFETQEDLPVRKPDNADFSKYSIPLMLEGGMDGWLNRVKIWARSLKRDVVALWIAARDARTPLLAKILAGSVAAYALSPIDLIPDFIPVLGYLDDLLIVPLGIALAVRLIPAPLMAEYRLLAAKRDERPPGRAGLAIVIAIWLAATALAGWLSWR